MMKILTLAYGILLILSAALAADPCSARRRALIELKTLKANPEVFDGKAIRVSGMLKSGHLGVSLRDAQGLSIRIRAHDELKSRNPFRVCEDTLYKRLWSLSETPKSGEDEVLYLIELEGVVRMLRDRDGKPAKDFSVFGQWPIELIVTQVVGIRESRQ
jgi:hypothetical protein